VSPDGDSGVVRLDGGLRLSRTGTNLDLTKPRIELGKGQIGAQVAGNRTAIVAFDAESATTTLKATKVTITAIEAALTSDGAAAINEAFGGSSFSTGDALGRFEVQGTTQAG
jgi:Htaa